MKSLREFDLDAPTLPKEERHLFRLYTRNVTALYERLFESSTGTGKFWKLLVEVVPVVTKPVARDLLGVLTLQIAGRPEAFFRISDYKKKKQTLRWLMEGVQKAVDDMGWSIESFEKTVSKILIVDYENEWIWKRSVMNSSKSLRAEVVVDHRVRDARIKVRFRRSNGDLVSTQLLCSTLPDEFAFVPCLGKLEWADDNTIKLKAKTGSHSWKCTFEK